MPEIVYLLTNPTMPDLVKIGRTEPTLGVIAICASRLQQASHFIRQSPAHAHVADRFLALSQQCQEIVNEGAVELELV